MAEVTYRNVENAPYSDGVKDNGGALKTKFYLFVPNFTNDWLKSMLG